MTDNMNISRRYLLALGGAVAAGLLARPGSLYADDDMAVAQVKRELGNVKIREKSPAHCIFIMVSRLGYNEWMEMMGN